VHVKTGVNIVPWIHQWPGTVSSIQGLWRRLLKGRHCRWLTLPRCCTCWHVGLVSWVNSVDSTFLCANVHTLWRLDHKDVLSCWYLIELLTTATTWQHYVCNSIYSNSELHQMKQNIVAYVPKCRLICNWVSTKTLLANYQYKVYSYDLTSDINYNHQTSHKSI